MILLEKNTFDIWLKANNLLHIKSKNPRAFEHNKTKVTFQDSKKTMITTS